MPLSTLSKVSLFSNQKIIVVLINLDVKLMSNLNLCAYYEWCVSSSKLGLKNTSCSTGWYSLAEAQFKLHRYSDSATSCSQGMSTILVIDYLASKCNCLMCRCILRKGSLIFSFSFHLTFIFSRFTTHKVKHCKAFSYSWVHHHCMKLYEF